ncbi:MAG: PleD family two-component system response regulator [Myxococcaceae bacterium]
MRTTALPPGEKTLDILVVDDDRELATLLERFLTKQGYTVTLAEDGLQALLALEEKKFGLVITDLMMPHIDGITFTEKLKGNPETAHIPVILITAWPSEDISDKGMRKGVALTLGKPIDFDRLLTLVKFAE